MPAWFAFGKPVEVIRERVALNMLDVLQFQSGFFGQEGKIGGIEQIQVTTPVGKLRKWHVFIEGEQGIVRRWHFDYNLPPP